jgi:glycosyltransferase involved in cell wall biosynthesis
MDLASARRDFEPTEPFQNTARRVAARSGGARPRRLNIGIEATCWHNDRGYGRHARSLIGALLRLDVENDYTLFMDLAADAGLPGARTKVRVIDSSAPASRAASAAGHRSPRDMWRMARSLADRSLDVLIFPSAYSYVPVITRAKKIVFIHDVIPETYPRLTIPNPKARLFWRAKIALSLMQADLVATVSEYSRRGLIERLHVRPGRVRVVGEASDPVFRRLESAEPSAGLEALGLGEPGRTLVYVGGFGPHKNLGRLLEVIARLAGRPEFSDVRLVMVGEYEREIFYSHAGALRDQVRNLDLAGRVIFTGYLPDQELVVLLNRATALVLPSLMEGFGLPAVEAAACGCPVVATTASPLPQVLAGAGLFIDPESIEQLEEALREVLSSEPLRTKLADAGLEASARLTWKAAAGQLLDVIREVATR